MTTLLAFISPKTPNRLLICLGMLGVLSLGAVGCSKSNQPAADEAELSAENSLTLDHTHDAHMILDGDKAVKDAFKQGRAHFVQHSPFQQIGFFYRSDASVAGADRGLSLRVRYTDGKWSAWRPVDVTWQENDLRVGRAILDQEALEVELRNPAGLQAALIEFSEDAVDPSRPLTRDLPFEKERADRSKPEAASLSADALRTTGQALAPRSLVIPRAEWGARDPNKVCGSTHTPYRMAIHHTYSPATDGGDAAAQMRGMQAFHIDTRGWCDIGYHFVVSQSADIYQGRSTETRLGAHVGGQNTGNIGTCLIGNFQPGYPTTQTPSESQLAATGRMIGWIHETYGIALNRDKVKGHREHAGQTTSCPGTNLLNKIPHILELAAGGSQGEYDISVKVNWKGTENFYTQGASHNVADALPGDTFKAEILIKNKSTDVIRNVWGGFQIRGPYLKGTNYTIYSDHPAYDQSTWTVNDANDASENPPNNNIGANGKLNLNAFSPGETKRVLVDIEATQYSAGAPNTAVVRGWIQHAESASGTIYGDQNSWGESAGTNELENDPRGYARVDVLERDTWLFDDTGDEQNLEGWSATPDAAVDTFKLNTNEGSLSVNIAGADAQLVAPGWTEVNADQYDQLVLRLRSHDATHAAAVYWGSGDGFDGARSLAFEAPGDGEFNDIVIPMGSHSAWSGTVSELAIAPLAGANPGEGANGWYDLDAIFFQSSTEQSTSAPDIAYSDGPPVDIISANPDNNDPGNNDPGNNDPGNNDPGNNDPGNGDSGADDPPVKVNSGGCSMAADPENAPLSPVDFAWVVALGAFGLMGRRRRT